MTWGRLARIVDQVVLGRHPVYSPDLPSEGLRPVDRRIEMLIRVVFGTYESAGQTELAAARAEPIRAMTARRPARRPYLVGAAIGVFLTGTVVVLSSVRGREVNDPLASSIDAGAVDAGEAAGSSSYLEGAPALPAQPSVAVTRPPNREPSRPDQQQIPGPPTLSDKTAVTTPSRPESSSTSTAESLIPRASVTSVRAAGPVEVTSTQPPSTLAQPTTTSAAETSAPRSAPSTSATTSLPTSSGSTTSVTLEPLSDLALSETADLVDALGCGPTESSCRYRISLVVQNLGEVASEQTFLSYAFQGGQPADFEIPRLEPDETFDIRLEVLSPPCLSCSLRANIDPNKVITEQDETNNLLDLIGLEPTGDPPSSP